MPKNIKAILIELAVILTFATIVEVGPSFIRFTLFAIICGSHIWALKTLIFPPADNPHKRLF